MRTLPLPYTLTTLISTIFLCTHKSCSLNTDGVLLLSFKLSILSDPLHVLDSWSTFDATPCSWRGVTCGSSPSTWWSNSFLGSSSNSNSDSARVTGVSLPGAQLLGSIPANFGLLDQLQTVNLSSNSINGSIPDTLFSLSSLRVLDVSNNLISGQLPESVGGLRSLQILDVSENALSGKVPRNLATLQTLTSVSFKGNYFSGNLPGGFNQVQYMDLSANLLNGSLPLDFGGGNITYFNISYNRLSGEIPPEFGRNFSESASLDFSYNNLTGEIPDSAVFLNQHKDSFAGNLYLCGPPSGNPCPNPSSPTGLPTASDQPIPPPAIAAIPKTFDSSPDGGLKGPHQGHGEKSSHGLKPRTIAWIVVGDITGVAILAMILIYVYKRKTAKSSSTTSNTLNAKRSVLASPAVVRSSTSDSSASESKGTSWWACLRKRKHAQDEDEDEEEDDDDEESVVSVEKERGNQHEEKGQLVTLDGGESELELETLLKASAYILGASGPSIIYKAVLEDGTVFAVRRVGESSSVERLKDFDGHVRAIAKLAHPNLVRVHGYYWAADEKLIIYDYVPNGSLANARYRKAGSSPCHIPWEVRLRVAKGVARGLTYIHEKKHVHGNIKPSNILLDMEMEPKIADFGLERLTTGKSGYVSTRHFGSKRSTASRDSFGDHSVGATPSPSASSIGCVSPYQPPESLRSLKPNPKWDVYSFGVLLLELLTGKVIITDELGPPVLAGLVVGLEDKTKVLRMADPAIRADLEGKEDDLFACLKLGYNCVSHVPQKRPSMKEVLHILEKMSTSSIASSSYYYGS